jgi:hypothetical protein
MTPTGACTDRWARERSNGSIITAAVALVCGTRSW